MAFLEGFVLGLGMIIFLGPVFFTLLKSALGHGFWAGFAVASGIFISDVLVVLLCSLGAIPFFKDPENQFWLGVVGSIILLVLGFKYMLRPNVSTDADLDLKAGDYTTFLIKGFMVNFVNPFVFVVWIGIIGLGQTRFGAGVELWIFLGSVLLGIFSTDVSKVVFADRIKRFIRPRFLLRVYQLIGVVLILFSFRMMWHVASSM